MRNLFIIAFLFLMAQDCQESFVGWRGLASGFDSQVEQLLDESLFLMSSNAIKTIEETTNATFDMSIREIDSFVKNTIKKVRHKLLTPVKSALFRYPDAVVFTTLFRIMKGTILYPFLIYSGNAHLIPAVGAILLNSDLWIGVYIVVRNQVANILGRVKFGHSLEQLHLVRDALLQVEQSRNISYHQIALDEEIITVDVRRGTLRSRIKIIEEKAIRQGISVKQLEDLVADKRFIEEAIIYKGKPYLYNEILLSKILQSDDSSMRLLQMISPKNMVDENIVYQQFARKLKLYIEKMNTYLIGFDDSINRTVKEGFGYFHPEFATFKWQLWRYKRSIKKELNSLRMMEYEFLADFLDKPMVDLSVFEKRLGDSKQFIAHKVKVLDLISHEVGVLRDLDGLGHIFKNLGNNEQARCFFLLQQLAR